MNRIGWCCVEWDITFFDYEVAQKKYNEKRCIAVFSLAYSFNAAGQGNQWSFKATDCNAYYRRRVRSYAHVFCAILMIKLLFITVSLEYLK